ncbi:MAG: VWA domain-containing protein, partial [Ilumatobacteraceae bacterium]
AGDGIEEALAAIASIQPASSGNDGNNESAAIVLLSDGGTTTGEDPHLAAQDAAAARVPISTITYGTDSGTVTINGEVIPVPPDGAAMNDIATTSGGKAFDAASIDQLTEVYAKIKGTVAHDTRQSELIVWFLALAVVLMTLAALGSMLWTGRFL